MFGWCGKEIDLIPILKASPVLGNTTLRSAAHSQYADMFCWSTPRRRCRLGASGGWLEIWARLGGWRQHQNLVAPSSSCLQGRRNISKSGRLSHRITTFDRFFPLFRLWPNLRGALWPMGSDTPAVLQPHCPNRVNEETPNQFVFRSRISCETSFSCRDNFLHFLLRRPYQLTQQMRTGHQQKRHYLHDLTHQFA